MAVPPITAAEVAQALGRRFKPHASAGLSPLPPYLLKYAHPALHEPIAALLTRFTKQGLPTSWAKLSVMPVPKPGLPPSAAASYRPISVLGTMAKVYALIVLARLEAHPAL
jgi:hypothetical protein